MYDASQKKRWHFIFCNPVFDGVNNTHKTFYNKSILNKDNYINKSEAKEMRVRRTNKKLTNL